MSDLRPIGVFDSGLGGLTAVRELTALLPQEDIIYFGDTSRIPYGTRGRDTIIKYSRQDARFIQSFGVKVILIACNTASYAALDILQSELSIPVYGVIQDASRCAAESSRSGKIAVIATPATISGHAYAMALKKLRPDAEITEKACPLFVPLVENGRISPDDPVVKLLCEEYMEPVKQSGADTVILGCTHYPLLSESIGRCLPGVKLINSAAEAVKTLEAEMREKNISAPADRKGSLRYFVSDSVESFSRCACMYLGRELGGSVEWVDIERY